MGRFYKTTSDTPIDYMYRDNIPLMAKVIDSNDQAITGELNDNAQAKALANFNYLPQDQDAATKIQQSLEGQADTIASNIQSDPANWRKQLQPLRQFRQQLMDNYTNGPISKYVSNYNAAKASNDAIDKQVNLYNTSGGKKGVSQNRALLAKQYASSQFTGTNYDSSTKGFNAYKGIGVMDDIDITKRLSEGLEKMKADGEIKVGDDLTQGGQYFNKQTSKWEGVTPDKILSIVSDRLQSDPQLMDYFRQNTQIGYSKNIFDSEGKFIAPFSYTPVDLSSDEQRQIDSYKDKLAKLPNGAKKIQLQATLDQQANKLGNRRQLQWNDGSNGRPNSELSPIMQGIVRQFSYSKSESGNDLKNNSLYNARFTAGQEYTRQTRALRQADNHFNETQKNLNDRFKERLDWDKYKFDNSQAKGTLNKGKTPAPVETGVSRLGTNSFESYTIKDNNGQDIPFLSNNGLAHVIDDSKDKKTAIDSQLKDINKQLEDNNNIPYEQFHELNIKKNDLEKQSEQLNSNLTDARNYYNMATDAALTKNKFAGTLLADKDIDLYKSFSNDRDGSKYKAWITNLRKTHPDVPDRITSDAEGAAGVQTYKPAPIVQQHLDKLNDYINAKKRVDQGRDQFLASIRKSNITTDAIVPNEKEGAEVSNLLLNNAQGLEIFNEDASKAGGILDSKGISWFRPKADNYNMTFGNNMDLAHYIEKNNVKMNILQIGGSTKLGKGNAVVKVTFDDPNKEIPKDIPYYISTTPEIQKALSTKFSKNKNPDVAKIATSLGDDEANSIRNQLAQPDINTYNNTNAPEKTVYITTPSGSRVPLYVTPLDNGHISVQYEDKEGKMKPYPRVRDEKGNPVGGLDGFFNGPEDFIEQHKGHRQLSQSGN